MTDNRMTELKSLSKLKMAGKLRFWRGTIEIPESELHAICDEIQAEHEQAMAATLGNEINGEISVLEQFANEVVDVDECDHEEYEEIMAKYVEKIRLGLVL